MGYELVSRSARTVAGSLLGLGLLSAPIAATMAAEVSVGAGLRTSYTVTNIDGIDGGEGTFSEFAVNSARLYVSGTVTDKIGFMFNTAFNQAYGGSEVAVMDIAAKFAFSDQFNIYAGRFLAPSDRANLYGPYYGSNWGFAQDGVQDGYPFNIDGSTDGRSDGVMYWGQFGKTKVAAGVFHNDGPSDGDLKGAARLQFDLWDSEDGYYQNGSYYGAKDLLAFGIAAQTSSGESAMSLDFLLEKKLMGGGVVTFEAEYADYNGYGFYPGISEGKGYYGLAAYMFPQVVGMGKFQLLGKYGTVTPSGGPDLDTTELNINYIIKDQNARIQLFYLDNSDYSGAKKYGIGLQIQM
jgi:hypothetical protein